MNMKIIGVIPARYGSTRFPGKPIVDICGKPMIWWVYQQAKKVQELSEVYIATDDEKIKSVCDELDMNVIMTSTKHSTGTDRVAEVASKIKADLYVNIQGDEPMIEPENIVKAITPFIKNTHIKVTNLMTKINNPVEIVNFTIPKVVTNKDGRGIFLSRSGIPYPKGKIDFDYYKQVCVYCFTYDALMFFTNSERGKIESIEDIEILRFIENDFYVQFETVISNTIAVDTNNDLDKVKKIISKKIELGELTNE